MRSCTAGLVAAVLVGAAAGGAWAQDTGPQQPRPPQTPAGSVRDSVLTVQRVVAAAVPLGIRGPVLVGAEAVARESGMEETLDIPVRPNCDGRTATLVGTSRDDVLRGTGEHDVIDAERGDDLVRGDGDDDVICGHLGDDQLYGGPSDDEIFGSNGDDDLFGDGGDDLLVGHSGNDRLFGGEGDDLCVVDSRASAELADCETVVDQETYDREPVRDTPESCEYPIGLVCLDGYEASESP